ncbi:MAG: RNA polymerase sigma factor [Bacteroidales bacterium]
MELNQHLTEKGQQDLLLVKRALRGDQKAYAELLDRYRDSIYFMLLKMVNNPSDAEDLTIEAFGKAFRNLVQYTPNFAFSTWLFKIASNNAIDFMRKKRTGHVSIDQQIDESHEGTQISLPDDKPDPEEHVIRQQKMVLMHDVVSRLKPRYRKLIELRYFNELSYEEIAAELDLPLGTVKAQLFRARELLYQILKNTDRSL